MMPWLAWRAPRALDRRPVASRPDTRRLALTAGRRPALERIATAAFRTRARSLEVWWPRTKCTQARICTLTTRSLRWQPPPTKGELTRADPRRNRFDWRDVFAQRW